MLKIETVEKTSKGYFVNGKGYEKCNRRKIDDFRDQNFGSRVPVVHVNVLYDEESGLYFELKPIEIS